MLPKIYVEKKKHLLGELHWGNQQVLEWNVRYLNNKKNAARLVCSSCTSTIWRE